MSSAPGRPVGLTEAQLVALERAAAMGFHRGEPPVVEALRPAEDDAPALAMVAYAAHQRRLCTLPARAPAEVERLAAPEDPRPVVPEATRRRMLQLARLANRQRAPQLLGPVAWALRARGWRLHPFDTDLVASFAAVAGPTERWLAEVAGLDLGEDARTDDVDATTWQRLTPAPRAAWLRQQRHADPAAARGLLEAAWPSERAEARLRLLEALEVRLGPADEAFLAGLAIDRSQPVRERAAKMLARVQGELSEEAAAKVLAATFKVERVAFVGPKRLVLVSGADPARAYDVVAERSLAAVLTTIGLDLGNVLASTNAGMAPLLPAFGFAALRDGQKGLFRTFTTQALDAGWRPDGRWGRLVLQLAPALRRELLLPLADGPLLRAVAADLAAAPVWLRMFDGPLSPGASRRLRATPEWAALAATVDTLPALHAAAALVPGADARDAAAQLDTLDATHTALLRMLWTLLADLEGAP